MASEVAEPEKIAPLEARERAESHEKIDFAGHFNPLLGQTFS